MSQNNTGFTHCAVSLLCRMSPTSRRITFPLLAILPPALIALATEDVGVLVGPPSSLPTPATPASLSSPDDPASISSARVKSGNGITLSLLEDTRLWTNFWALYKHQSEKPKIQKS